MLLVVLRIVQGIGLAASSAELLLYSLTTNMAEVAEKRRAAREKRCAALQQVETRPGIRRAANLLAMVARLAHEARLSRFVYVSEKIT